MRVFIPRFIGAVLYFVVLSLIGTAAYAVVEGAELWDSFYMTVITVTAVGYDEHIPLSFQGQVLTTGLLALGLTGMGIWFALITSFIVELDLKDVLRRRRMEKEIANLKDHVVLCGAGRTGRQVMEELLLMGQTFVVIEREPSRAQWVQENFPHVPLVIGDATVDHNLQEAGVHEIEALIHTQGQKARVGLHFVAVHVAEMMRTRNLADNREMRTAGIIQM